MSDTITSDPSTIISTTTPNQIDSNKSQTSILNGTSSSTSTSTSTSISSSETQLNSPSNISSSNDPNCNAKPTTMPISRKMRLQQMLWHSLMEAKGEIVGVTKTNGETYSGVLFAIEPNELQGQTQTQTHVQNGCNNNNNNSGQGQGQGNEAAWKYIVLKYVQKMNDPNMDPSKRMKAPFMEQLKIVADDFAVLSAKGLTDHTNSYRRNDRQAFNDATGRKLHRKERELVRWDAGSSSIDTTELENDDDLDELRNGSYDQFKANEKYNISATFDESIYTSHLDKSDPDYTKNLKEAKLDEQRIMDQPVDNKHVADDRSYFINRNVGNNKNPKYNVDMDQDEEDAYSRVLHEASMSKQTINSPHNNQNNNKKKTKNSYQPPHLRNNNNNNNQNNKKNKGHNKQNNQRDNNNNNNNRRPPMNRDNNKNKHTQNQNQNQNQNQHNNNNMNTNSNRIDNNNNNQNQIQNQNINSPQNIQQNNQNQNQNQTINSPPNQNQNTPQNPSPNQQQSAAILQALANQNQILQQAKLAQFAHTNVSNSLGGGIFAGLPPHIAQIVQTVTPQNTLQNINQMTAQQLQVYQQQLLQQNQQQQIGCNSPNQQQQKVDDGTTIGKPIGEDDITSFEKDDTGSLNPHAKAFTPQISPNQNQKQQNNQNQQQQNQNQNQNQVQQQQNNALTTPSGSAQQLLTQQQQQALLTQQLPIGQYNYNPATGQYVLNPFAPQGQQQQLALLQQTQYQAHLQQIAIQQQLTQQQSDPTSQLLAHQQQLLAHQQAQQAQAQLLAQQAQANGLNIGAPLFTPSNMQQQTASNITGVNTQQVNQLTQQTNQFQHANIQQQQQALLAQANAQAQAQAQLQAQQQQFLSFGGIPQQQFYMGNANMQNLMQQ